jgi:histidinol-phosphate/aromatic aminotransferase/cobyric acid decarboxylase-like protein
VSFPLGDWVNQHHYVRHNLARSGLIGVLKSLPRALARLPEPDDGRLRAGIARVHGVRADRVFVTHGATEANALVLLYLARSLADRHGRAPTIYHPPLEYPPLGDAAVAVGFRRGRSIASADAVVLSDPGNPMGVSRPWAEVERLAEGGRPVVADQTFREFTTKASMTRAGIRSLWVTGSFTKIYGADEQRLGFAIAPEAEAERFYELHALLLDEIPEASVSAGLAILRDRDRILAEARALFQANVRTLRERVPDLPELEAPTWFDRGLKGFDGDAFARRLLRRSILVCPGSFFGDPAGVRVTLTRRTFPEDLAAYWRFRAAR